MVSYKSTFVCALLLLTSLTLQQETPKLVVPQTPKLVVPQTPKLVVPQTFGLMTMTYTRGDDNSQFEKYLSRYAFMDCPIVTEINIVWNNERTPEQMGILNNASNWKRPIHFYKTPHNSLDWRWKRTNESKARVFFSIDDDIIISCKELTKAFRVWQANAIGEIGPIITFASRYFEYTKKNGHRYMLSPQEFFNFGMVSYSFVSVHFMELYYSGIWQLEEMRKVVIEKFNCEDIAIEWLAEYFYPELQTILIKGQVRDLAPAAGISKASDHFAKRHSCLNRFTHIFGATVLTQKPLTDQFAHLKRWTFPFRNASVLLKKQYLEREVINRDQRQGETNYSLNEQSAAEKDINLQPQLSQAILNQTELVIKNQNLEAQVERYKQQVESYKQQIERYKQLLDSTKLTKQETKRPVQSLPISEREAKICEDQKRVLVYVFLGLVGVMTIIVIFCWRKRPRVQKSDQLESSSVNLSVQVEASDRRTAVQ